MAVVGAVLWVLGVDSLRRLKDLEKRQVCLFYIHFLDSASHTYYYSIYMVLLHVRPPLPLAGPTIF